MPDTGDFDEERIVRAFFRYCRRHNLPRNAQTFYQFALAHDHSLERWHWPRVFMMYVIGACRAVVAFWGLALAYVLLGWLGVVGVIAVGAADQAWFYYKHGRWLMDADWMKGDDFFGQGRE